MAISRYRNMVTVVGAVSLMAFVAQSWAARPDPVTVAGTIPWMRTQTVGSQIQLDYVMCGEVGADHLVVREPDSAAESVTVQAAARVKLYQSVRVTGTLTRAEDGSLYVANAQVFAYLDDRGNILAMPLPRPVNGQGFDSGAVNVTGVPDEVDGIAPDAPSAPESGEGMLDSLTPGTISYAKSLGDSSSTGDLVGKVLTAKLGTYYYVEEPDRSSGIRVNATPPGVDVGTILTVSGTITTVDSERCIINPSVTTDGSTAIRPLGMPNKILGGGDWLYDDQTGAGQQGVTDGFGLNNIGLLVRSWGRVTDYGGDYVVINDGSDVGVDGVKVDLAPSGLAHYLRWGDEVAVTGISSCFETQDGLVPVVKPRLPGDLVDLSDTTGPSTPAVTAAEFSACGNALYATWSASDEESGIVGYNYAVGTSPTNLAVPWKQDWIPATTNEILCEGSFSPGVDYYFYVMVLNGAGIAGSVGVSNATEYVSNKVVYVKSGSGGNGTSWANAYGSLAAALQNVTSGKEIWVAEGTYAQTVSLVSNVDVYGGFVGTECARVQRDWNAHPTVLRGTGGGGTYVAVNGASGLTLDGFVISGSSIGIWLSGVEDVEISHNTITDNSHIGILCDTSSASIHDNHIHHNVGSGIMISYCDSVAGVWIVNNTIRENSNGSNGAGITFEDSDVYIYNSILLNNYWGVSDIDQGYSALTLHNNCAFGNAGGNYLVYPDPSGDNLAVDPKLDGVHLKPDSQCIGAGENNVVGSGWNDIDGEARIQPSGGAVDIGADESDGCWYYNISFTCDPPYAAPEGSVNVTAHIKDWNGDPVPYARVVFSITDGEITHVNGREVAGPDYHGFTNASGDITVTVTRDTAGKARLTAEVASLCGPGSVTKTRSVWFLEQSADDDWPMFQHDVAHTGVSECVLVPELTEYWHKNLAGDSNGTLWSSPVAVDGVVYVGTNSANGDLYAFDADDGTQIAHETLGSPIHGTPCLADGRVYVGTANGVLHSRYAAGQQGHNALDADWTKSFPGESITGGVTVWNGAAYFGTLYGSAGRLHRVDTSGNHTDSYVGTPYGVDHATPAIDESLEHAYISDSSCAVTAMRCDTGVNPWPPPGYWRPDMSTFYSSPTIYGGYIFGGSTWDYVYRIVDTGTACQQPQYWRILLNNGDINATVAATDDDKLYFGTLNGTMYCVDAEDVTFQQTYWTANLGSPVSSSALISGPTSVLFVCDEDGVLRALDTTDGSPLSSYDISLELTGATMKSSLAAANGRLFVVVGNSGGRRLCCFGP